VLWFVPLLLSMAAYAGLSRLTPALSRAIKRPRAERREQPGGPMTRAA
jgi:hypothetical protein